MRKPVTFDFAGLAPQRVSILYFSNQLELTEVGIKNRAQRAHGAVGGCRHVENAAAQGPGPLVPFGGRAIGGGPCVAAEVERTGIDD